MYSARTSHLHEFADQYVLRSITELGATAVYTTTFRRMRDEDPAATHALLRASEALFMTSDVARQRFIDSRVHRYAVSYVIADFKDWENELVQPDSTNA